MNVFACKKVIISIVELHAKSGHDSTKHVNNRRQPWQRTVLSDKKTSAQYFGKHNFGINDEMRILLEQIKVDRFDTDDTAIAGGLINKSNADPPICVVVFLLYDAILSIQLCS
mmetsp:Transcript_12043/g.34438  ORF Transcript_12043/g.34438 Transcript_12043/m.34438 type:complete len:113 (-) Transcript_12043:296-634(-)